MLLSDLTNSCVYVGTVTSFSALAIFFSWMDLLLHVRKFPTLSIYIVMITDLIKTFLKFSITFFLFVIAFAFFFYSLFGPNVSFYVSLKQGKNI